MRRMAIPMDIRRVSASWSIRSRLLGAAIVSISPLARIGVSDALSTSAAASRALTRLDLSAAVFFALRTLASLSDSSAVSSLRGAWPSGRSRCAAKEL